MAEAKTINLLLSNGTLSGLLTAQFSKWDGILFASPRASYQILSQEKESEFWGVYLLVSDNKVYIGQTNDLLRRIKEHDKTKQWWEKVVLITTKDNSLNRSDIDYLENKLINLAKTKNTLITDNVQYGNTPKVNRYRKIDLNDLLDGALLLLELIGINVFKKQEIKTTTKDNFINSTKNLFNLGNSSRLTKKQAIQILNDHEFTFNNAKISFSNLNFSSHLYWLNPSIQVLNCNWYIILNNPNKRKLIVIKIKPNTFCTYDENKKYRLYTRSDNPNRINLKIKQESLIDIKSNVDFSRFISTTLEY